MSSTPTDSRRKSLLQGLLIAVLFVMAQVLASVCALLQLNMDRIAQQLPFDNALLLRHPLVFIYWTAGWYVVLIIVLWWTRLCRRNCMTAGLKRAGRLHITDWCRALSAFLLLMVGCSTLTAWWDLPDAGSTALFQSINTDTVGILLLCLLGPLTEECVFREGIARQLHHCGLHPIWAACLAGVAFAIVHANPAQAIPAAIMGWALGLFYFQTGNLRLCFTFHVLNNTLALILLRFPAIDAAVCTWPPSWLAAITFVSLLAGSYIIYRWTLQPLRQCK